MRESLERLCAKHAIVDFLLDEDIQAGLANLSAGFALGLGGRAIGGDAVVALPGAIPFLEFNLGGYRSLYGAYRAATYFAGVGLAYADRLLPHLA